MCKHIHKKYFKLYSEAYDIKKKLRTVFVLSNLAENSKSKRATRHSRGTRFMSGYMFWMLTR